MPQLWRAPFVFLAASLLCSCTEEGAILTVDLRTDFVPGAEFVLVETVLEPEGAASQTAMHGALQGAEVVEGLRVARFTGIAPGDQQLRVVLRRPNGQALITREVDLAIQRDFAVTVVLDRRCANVSCGDGEACVSGVCVDAGCTPETPDRCPDPACTGDTECDAPVASCAAARCVEGACFQVGRADACEPTDFCSPDVGCLAYPTLPDASLPDAGMDGGTDGGADGGTGPLTPILARPVRGEMRGSALRTDDVPRPNRPKLLFWGTGDRDRVEIELRSCTAAAFPCAGATPTTFEHMGSDVFTFPPEPLARGMFAWRARACLGSDCSDWADPSWFVVADSRDVDGDGLSEAVVGARSNPTPAGGEQGEIFVTLGADLAASTPSQRILRNSLGGRGSLGYALTTGDVTGDEVADILAGAPLQQVDADTHRGSLQVFRGRGTWPADVPLADDFLPSPALAGAVDDFTNRWFGAAVAYVGDVTGDGFGDFVVGEPGEHPTYQEGMTRDDDPGRVHLYAGTSGSFGAPVRTFTDPDGVAGDGFGAALAGCDVDGDGVNEIVVGVPARAAEAGEVLVFEPDGTLAARLPPPAPGRFGHTVVCLGDVDEDGIPDLGVGAPTTEGSSGMFDARGAAYLYFGLEGAVRTDPSVTLAPPVEERRMVFGWSMRAADYDGDSGLEVFVGAFGAGSSMEGAVYRYESGDNWVSPPGVAPLPTTAGFVGNCLSPLRLDGGAATAMLVGAAGLPSDAQPGRAILVRDLMGEQVLTNPTAGGQMFGWACP